MNLLGDFAPPSSALSHRTDVVDPTQSRGLYRHQEHAEVEAYLLKRPYRSAGPAGVARPDVLVHCDEGREVVLGE